jgi:hypothetical protein
MEKVEEFIKKPEVKCLFWALVLVLLLVVLWKVRSSGAEHLSSGIRQQDPYSAGATMRVLGQQNTIPYLESDLVYLDQANSLERRKMEADADAAATEAAKDQLALAGSAAGGEAVAGVAGTKAREWMTSDRGEASTTGFASRYIIPTEKMTATNEAPQMWMIGDDISELKHEVAGQSPDLSPNRWTLQMQNQVN